MPEAGTVTGAVYDVASGAIHVVGSLEYSEISQKRQAKFARDCTAKLRKLMTDHDLVDKGHIVYFSGYK